MNLRSVASALTALLTCVPLLASAGNVLLTDIASISVNGVPGVLRGGSTWAPAPAALGVQTVFDGSFRPTGTLWTDGTFWWDELATQGNAVSIEVQLNAARSLDRFVVQGDDNEDYLVDWWDGAAWQLAYTAAAVFTFGMETRDSGLLMPVSTDRLRIRAQGGDGYYALSEVQAFEANPVPEPGSLALVVLAAAALVSTSRRRQRPGR